MSRPLLIAVAAVVAISFCFIGLSFHQKRAARIEFRHQVESLLQQGSRLTAMTSQGATLNEFRSQLANVRGDYDLLKQRWEKEQWLYGYGSLTSAVSDWDLVLLFWDRDFKLNQVQFHISKDPDLLSFYMSRDPKMRALVSDDGEAGVNLKLALRAFMSDASDHFDEAKRGFDATR